MTADDPLRPPSTDPQPQAGGLPGYSAPAPPGAFGEQPPAATFGGPPGPGGQQLVLAGWWRRVGASVIDSIIVGLAALVILMVFGGLGSLGFTANEDTGVATMLAGIGMAFLVGGVAMLLYAPLMMARTNGQTLGRMATGIRVVRAKGEPMTFGFAMLREVAVKWLLFGLGGSAITGGIATLLDYLWPLWDDENRALHDMIVDTRTVLK